MCSRTYHASLVYALVGVLGVLLGLSVANLLFPRDVSDDTKLAVAALVGAFVAVHAKHAEPAIIHVFGAIAGAALGVVANGVAADLIAPETAEGPNAFAAFVVAGASVGLLAAKFARDGATVMAYSVVGGFLLSSSASYALWRRGVEWGEPGPPRRDLWLVDACDPKIAVRPRDARNEACFLLWCAATALGVFMQNTMCAVGEREEEEETGGGGGEASRGTWRREGERPRGGRAGEKAARGGRRRGSRRRRAGRRTAGLRRAAKRARDAGDGARETRPIRLSPNAATRSRGGVVFPNCMQ